MKGKIIIWIMTTIACFNVSPINAQSSNDAVRYQNIYMNIQYAGNIGLVAIGAGTESWNQKLYLGFVYGYLPKKMHDVEVHTLAVKAHHNFFTGSIIEEKLRFNFYAGAGINFGFTGNTYFVYPDYYPDGYYYTNAM